MLIEPDYCVNLDEFLAAKVEAIQPQSWPR